MRAASENASLQDARTGFLLPRGATPPAPIEVLEKVSPACRIGTLVFVERVRGSHSGGP